LLLRLRATGAHILISSHILDFLDGFADRVVFIKDGEAVKDFTADGQSTESAYRALFLS
jgi:ABC-type multidrug transport system ATPase subunit